MYSCVSLIEILDLECVLCHVTGVQNENKNALINPPSWIFPRSVVYKMSWGEFNLGRGFIGYPKGRNRDIKLVN